MGTLLSDLTTDFEATLPATTAAFDFQAVNGVLADLDAKCRAFIAAAGSESVATEISFSAEARYPEQIWEIEVPIRKGSFTSGSDLEDLRNDFHRVHEEIFAFRDAGSEVEAITWRARARCKIRDVELGKASLADRSNQEHARDAYFRGHGLGSVPVYMLPAMALGESVTGPAIVETPVTTIVLDPGATAKREESGSLVILVNSHQEPNS
jgi:N-methylhydantoinase A